ncbi:hypothetical protein LTR85_001540 [Meristemomyces frigidus]|nr:hypothetical protein LTR85_001540 [Meristemomyces frigidus]
MVLQPGAARYQTARRASDSISTPAAKRHHREEEAGRVLAPVTDEKLRDPAVNFFSPQNVAFYASAVYTSLDHKRQEIRLLEVLPGSKLDQLHCNLAAPIPLEDASGRYEAVSYCAGNPKDTVCVTVNGLDFNIFASLNQALHRLRRGKKTRVLWIDQVCINQDDLEERSSQVQLMGEIYANAKRGLIRMGSLPEESLVLEQLGFLDERRKEELANRKKIIIRDPHDREMHKVYQNIGAPGRRYKDPGYTRFELWSAMEIVMVPEAIVFGSTIAFDLDVCWPVHDATATYFQSKTDIHYNRAVADLENRKELLRLQSQLVPSQLGRFCAARRQRVSGKETLSPSVALRTARLASSTDPRDRVYAFLGLLKPVFGILPNYAQSNAVEDVYFDVCCAIIMESKSLNFLSEGQELNRGPCSGLSSWIPDWRIDQGRVALADRHFMKDTVPAGVWEMQIMSTAHRFCAGDKVAEVFGKLRMFGSRVDQLGEFCDVLEPDEEWDSWMSARDDAKTLCEAHRLKRVPGGALPEAFERLSEQDGDSEEDSMPEHNTEPEEYEETIKDWEEQWKSAAELEADRDLALWWQGDTEAIKNANFGADDSDVHAIENAIYCTCMHSDDAYGAEDEWERAIIKDDFYKGRRRFFLTESSTMGMGPPCVRKGDVVCVFLGCSCPLLIRKHGNGYILVGEGFVKGWMYGKAIYQWDAYCLGERSLTRVALH